MRPSRLFLMIVSAMTALSVGLAVMDLVGFRALLALWALFLFGAIVDMLMTARIRPQITGIEFPIDGFVGQTVDFEIALSGNKDRRFDIAIYGDPGLKAPLMHDVAGVTNDEKCVLKTPIFLADRGDHELSAVMLRYDSRLQLFEMLPKVVVAKSIKVMPDVRRILDGSIEAQVAPLTDGTKVFDLQGQGTEFHQLKDYQPGMDPRQIDWKRSARMHNLIARETRVERNHQLIIGFDYGRLMAETQSGLKKLDHAINAGLALTWASQLAGDQIGTYAFASRPGAFYPPRAGHKAYAQMQRLVSSISPEESETNHTLGLSHLRSQLHRRSLVVIFSDFTDTVTAELMIENLGVITKQHVVLYVALKDGVIERTASVQCADIGDISEAVAAMRLSASRKIVIDKLKRLGVLVLDTEPAMLSNELISKYIAIKSRELI